MIIVRFWVLSTLDLNTVITRKGDVRETWCVISV
jgi:hypothetical protein